ncbi:VOC family protein [Ekhidna sp.]|uniref:VOC family protein n=1 Tax=Ekhidna sp. TaxID=2608089 RepID=UPI0032ED7DA8
MGSTSSKKSGKKLRHYVNWFEIPALNLQRAVSFYNHIYDIEMETTESPAYAMAFFPADNGIGGAVVTGEGCVPSEVGPLVYLNGGKDLSPILNRIEDAGGRIVMPKTLIDEDSGYFALFIDSEGNRLALHSKS